MNEGRCSCGIVLTRDNYCYYCDGENRRLYEIVVKDKELRQYINENYDLSTEAHFSTKTGKPYIL